MIPNTKKIEMFIHCGECLKEWQSGKHRGKSMADISKFDVGWTEIGLQVWCQTHDLNVVHVDFEGHTHHANTTAKKNSASQSQLHKIKTMRKIKK